MKFTSRYGYVGPVVEQKEFAAEGLNEAGLSAGLFYFPGYGKYGVDIIIFCRMMYHSEWNDKTI